MSRLEEILKHNEAFVNNAEYEAYRTTKYPNKRMAILSCMDTRLGDLLPKAMNVAHGDAKMIRNAGAVVDNPFGTVMRSLLVSVYILKAEEVFIVGHHDCGMAGLHPDSILQAAREHGAPEERIDTLRRESGIDIDKWLTGFTTVEESVRRSVEIVSSHPLFPGAVPVHGLIIHPDTGKLDVVVRGSEAKESRPG